MINVSFNVYTGTYPAGTITEMVGETLKIICIISDNEHNETSANLDFYNVGQLVERRYVSVLNRSAIEMRIDNVYAMDTTFICKLNGRHGLSYNDVKVGYRPGPVKGLKCRAMDWKSMNCTFEQMQNPVPVHYKLEYHPRGAGQIYNCPLRYDYNKNHSCLLGTTYRKSHGIFNFNLYSNNTFGTYNQSFTINNFASVITSPPEKLAATEINSYSVTLSWEINFELLGFPELFDFQIISQSTCDLEWKTIDVLSYRPISKDSQKYYNYFLPLNYSHTWYDIRLRMRSSVAPNEEEMWSKWSNVTFQTAHRIPDYPPKVDAGSFNVRANGDLYVYWKDLPKCQQNGANYNYTVISSDKKHSEPSEQSLLMAVFRKDRVNLDHDMTITIQNYNIVGPSKDVQKLIIPKDGRRLAAPEGIKKVLANGDYRLSWERPKTIENITSYTIFWCVSKSELPNHCESSIDFVRVGAQEFNFVFKSYQTINFAVAANSVHSTSGMIWAMCTSANANDIGKIKTIWIPKLSATEIEVEWKLECPDKSIVVGYQLEYCPIKEPKTLDCKTPEQRINITDTTKYTLSDLSPYTTYKIIVFMFSNTTMGPPSEALANTTLEAPPSEPRNLIARDVRNSSVELFWDPPEYLNGVLMYYRVWANGKEHKVDTDKTMIKMNYTLENLKAYTHYEIVVDACTSQCSKSSKVEIATKTGVPGDIDAQPSIAERNNSVIGIKWQVPSFKGGHIDYFEVKTIFIPKNDPKIIETIIKTRLLSCYMQSDCGNLTGRYEFSVRAVNFVSTPHSKSMNNSMIVGSKTEQRCDENDTALLESLKIDAFGLHLQGHWSVPMGHSCNYLIEHRQFLLFSLLMVAALIISVLVFVFYRKIKDMKDILVQMPPGLEDLTGEMKKEKGCHIGMNGNEANSRPDIIPQIDNVSIMDDEQEQCLLKRSKNGSVGGECSSSVQSESSTRSDVDRNEDEFDYNNFGQSKHINSRHLLSDDEDDTRSSENKLQVI